MIGFVQVLLFLAAFVAVLLVVVFRAERRLRGSPCDVVRTGLNTYLCRAHRERWMGDGRCPLHDGRT